jgi:hypothetical protein
MKTLPLLTMLLITSTTLGQEWPGAGSHFPPAVRAKSPDGRWELICRNPTDHLFYLLLRSATKGTFRLLNFDRCCDGLWSPDSSHIAVTDWASSSGSDVLIYSVAHPRSSLSVAKLFPTNAMATAELHGHCYFSANEWLDNHRLRITVSGHRDEPPATGFNHRFIFDLTLRKFQETARAKSNKALQATAAPPRS